MNSVKLFSYNVSQDIAFRLIISKKADKIQETADNSITEIHPE